MQPNEQVEPARACRALAWRTRFASLATIAREPSGWPFATLVAVAFDPRGRPLLVLSQLAEHTKNLDACSRASLLVVDPDAQLDPLAGGRVTLVGDCARVSEPERASCRAAFIESHPSATVYASFGDFAVWRLEVAQIRWVGGFGRMEWVDAAAYAAAGSP